MPTFARKGVLFINLGSPHSPGVSDIRRYLREFLSDKRVMTMPAAVRWMIVNLLIAPFRPAAIRNAYQSIWHDGEFPLVTHGRKMTSLISDRLGETYRIRLAMRYGSPGLEEVLNDFRQTGLEKLLIFPLFPQYSSATTGSVLEKTLEIIKKWIVLPELITVSSFYDHPAFIQAWSNLAQPYYEKKPDHTVFSFHGLPENHILESDVSGHHCLKQENCCQIDSRFNRGCYRAQCLKTAQLLATALKLEKTSYSISFQSRLGKAKWLEPYTTNHVKQLGQRGVRKLLVICPSFVADCLETTHEIAAEVEPAFLSGGGRNVILVPSLNSSRSWINGLATMIREKI